MTYKVISTGSKGNAVIFNSIILIDCGVSMRALKEHIKSLKLVLTTHAHGDHFKQSTISSLASERPALRFACGEWMVYDLVKCGVKKANIDIVDEGKSYNYGLFRIEPVHLPHDVRNFGYKIYIGNEKIFYATDTNSLNGIEAKGFDLYMIEANYTEQELAERIRTKECAGIYPYEIKVRNNHLSKEKADDFIYRNIGSNSSYVYLHTHEGLEL